MIQLFVSLPLLQLVSGQLQCCSNWRVKLACQSQVPWHNLGLWSHYRNKIALGVGVARLMPGEGGSGRGGAREDPLTTGLAAAVKQIDEGSPPACAPPL